MSRHAASERLATHAHRLTYLICYLLILVVALRRRYNLEEGFNLELALVLVGLFTLLFASEARLSSRVKAYRTVYFALQMIIVQALGLFREYQDTWSVLYIVLGFQVAARCTRREALAWYGLFMGSLLVTLSAEFGLVSGPGRALAYIVIGVVLISYDIQYSQHEDALAESEMLVSELHEAHQKLADYTALAQELAAVQEHNRMVRELYDSVGQKIFAIQFAAESTRLMLGKDPSRAAGQLETLQAQTQSALGQMRQLIEQWRPG